MKQTLFGAVGAGVLIVASGAAQAVAVSGQGTWETTLQGRDLDGNLVTAEAYYDTTLNITWLADANYAQTNNYSGANGQGLMTWSVANTWATSLNYMGVMGWRLPTMVDTGMPGCDGAYAGTDCGSNVLTTSGTTVYSEMASMFYDTLGVLAVCSPASVAPPCIVQSGWGLTNTGPFSKLQDSIYWTGLEDASDTRYAWVFNFETGVQGSSGRGGTAFGWAVHDGDVGVAVPSVPLPAAAWLFGSGLFGLLGVSRKRRC